MKSSNSVFSLLFSVAALAFSGYPNSVQGGTEVRYGEPVDMGGGTIRTYLALDARGTPMELGVLFSRDSFGGLPTEPNTTGRCFDMNGNGQIDDSGECEGDYE